MSFCVVFLFYLCLFSCFILFIDINNWTVMKLVSLITSMSNTTPILPYFEGSNGVAPAGYFTHTPATD